MIVLLLFLYVVIGAIVTFALYYLRRKSGHISFGDSYDCVLIGIFWLVAAPFAFALYFAEEKSRRK